MWPNALRRPRRVFAVAIPAQILDTEGVAEWLVEQLGEDTSTLVGIDHGFSFPLRYFEVHRLKLDWSGPAACWFSHPRPARQFGVQSSRP